MTNPSSKLSTKDVQSTKDEQKRALERDIAAVRDGDWKAKNSLCKTFMSFLTNLAEKRSKDIAKINRYIEAGKEGLVEAANKFGKNESGEKFQLFALDFIQRKMDAVDGKVEKKGFFAKLFGG